MTVIRTDWHTHPVVAELRLKLHDLFAAITAERRHSTGGVRRCPLSMLPIPTRSLAPETGFRIRFALCIFRSSLLLRLFPTGAPQHAAVAMPSRGSSESPLPDIPEETTPLRLLAKTGQHRQPSTAAGKGVRNGASRHSGARNSRSAAAVEQTVAAKAANDSDLESPEPSSATSWLSQKLRWPVVPIYSDVGTGLLGVLLFIYLPHDMPLLIWCS